MKQEDFLKLVDKYNAGKCTPSEEALILRFCEEVQSDDMSRHWNPEQEEAIRTKILFKIIQSLNQMDRPSKSTVRRRLNVFGQVAASLLLIAGLAWMAVLYFNQNSRTVPYITRSTSKGERISITLSDGSMVRLNSESSIKYPETFAKHQRKVQLTGEAYFNIKHDTSHPFVVNTQHASTTVLGTQFNVRAKDSLTQVSLVKGSVEVSPRLDSDARSVLLKPRQEFILNKNTGQVTVREFDLYAVVGWKDNIFNFQKTDLAGVVAQLEAHFAVKIRFADESLKQYRTRGVFKGASAQEVLKTIFSVSPGDCMEVEVQREGLIIRKGSCHPN